MRLDTLSILLGIAVGAVGLMFWKPALVAAQPSGCPKCPEPYTYTFPPEGAF